MPAESVSNNVMKVLYPTDLYIPQYKKSKAFGTAKKDTQFTGEGTKYVVVSIAPGAGGSASMAEALANQSATQQVKFSLGRKKLYEVGSIDGEAWAAAKNGGGDNSKGAIVDLIKHATGRARYAFARTLSKALWSTGGGSRGRVNASYTPGSTTLTLTSRADAAGFFKGMKVQSAANDGYTTVTSARVGTQTLASVNRSVLASGVMVTQLVGSIAWDAAIAGFTSNDYLFRSGDYALYPNGIPGWAPVADPGGGDSFLGINRSTAGDINYLSGFRFFGNGQPKSQTLIDAGAEAHLSGLDLDTCFLNPIDLKDAFKEQGSYKTIEVTTDDPRIGYKGIQLTTAVGDLTVLSETDVPIGYAWIPNMSDWTVRSAGDAPMLLDFDGMGMFMRNPNGDDYQFRLGFYGNVENANTGNVVVAAFGSS
jgi:hypothetical protein